MSASEPIETSNEPWQAGRQPKINGARKGDYLCAEAAATTPRAERSEEPKRGGGGGPPSQRGAGRGPGDEGARDARRRHADCANGARGGVQVPTPM